MKKITIYMVIIGVAGFLLSPPGSSGVSLRLFSPAHAQSDDQTYERVKAGSYELAKPAKKAKPAKEAKPKEAMPAVSDEMPAKKIKQAKPAADSETDSDSQTHERVKAGSYELAKPAKKAKPAKEAKPAVNSEKPAKKTKEAMPVADSGGGQLTIGEDLELTFPVGLKECRVFNSKMLEKAVLQASRKGECEWIVLRSNSDWKPDTPLWLQMDKPLVLENKRPMAEGHPIVITNDTGRAIFFRTPRNGGCAVIIKKPDVAILGFTFEGAICH